MRVKQGFVSNSSSSSFILMTKNELTKEALQQALFGEEIDNPLLKGIATEMTDVLYNGIDISLDKQSIVEFLDYYYVKSIKELPDIIQEGISKGFIIHEGSVEDQNGDLERYLCYLSINIETDELVLKKEGGY